MNLSLVKNVCDVNNCDFTFNVEMIPKMCGNKVV